MITAKIRTNFASVLAVMARPLPELPNAPSYTFKVDVEKLGLVQTPLANGIALIWWMKNFRGRML